jgi:hypothetical protein
MKNILVIASVLIFLLTGCGSDDDSDKKEKKSFDDLSKISLSFNHSSRLEQNQNSRVTSNKMSHIIYQKNRLKNISTQNKMEEYACDVSGSFDIEIKENLVFIDYKDCIELDEETGFNTYTKGEVSLKTLNDTDSKIIMKNYFSSPNTNENYYFEGDPTPYYIGWSTDYLEMESSKVDAVEIVKLHGATKDYIKDKPIEENTYSNVIMKKNTEKQSWSFEGSITFKISCYNKTYTFRTKSDAWLVENSENPDFYTKGVIDVNNIRYSYSGTKITLSTQEAEETFEQQVLAEKLDRYIENEISKCSTTNIY